MINVDIFFFIKKLHNFRVCGIERNQLTGVKNRHPIKSNIDWIGLDFVFYFIDLCLILVGFESMLFRKGDRFHHSKFKWKLYLCKCAT